MTNDTSWGTVKEAAAILGVHTMTIRRYIEAGHLPARRKGIKLIEVDLDAVRAMTSPVEPTPAHARVYSAPAVAK